MGKVIVFRLKPTKEKVKFISILPQFRSTALQHHRVHKIHPVSHSPLLVFRGDRLLILQKRFK